MLTYFDWSSYGGGEPTERNERHQRAVSEREAEMACDDVRSVQRDHGASPVVVVWA